LIVSFLQAVIAETLSRYTPKRLSPDIARWRNSERQFKRFLFPLPAMPAVREGPPIGIVIQPWVLTPLPWFMITVGVLFRSLGHPVVLLWDDLPFGPDSISRRVMQKSLERMLTALSPYLPFYRLSDSPPVDAASLDADIERLATLNTTIRFRSEGEGSERSAYRASILPTLRSTGEHLVSLFQHQEFSQLVLGGGIYSTSGLFLSAARQRGIRVASLDSGQGILLFCTDGVAANLEDIPRAFHALEHDPGDAIMVAHAELDRRMAGRDTFVSQAVSATGTAANLGALLPLNQSFDASALGRHRVFCSQKEWITETVAWILKHTSETVVVRQHPVERTRIHAGNDDYGAMLAQHFPGESRVQYVPGDAPINTYDLIRHAKVTVPYVSTVGIEATLLGCPVVTQGRSHYADLGFVWGAHSREQYFEYLAAALRSELRITDAMKKKASLAYYLTQCCNFYFAEFTPTSNDFDIWVTRSLESLLTSVDFLTLYEVLVDDVPCSLVRHRTRVAALVGQA
jgi:hypothetical protein